MIYIGIDPGKTGAVAILNAYHDTQLIDAYKCPMLGKAYDEKRMATLLRPLTDEPRFAILEKVHSMPKQGAVSGFNFGMGFGIWRGILSALEIPYELITPQKWKKEFSLIGKEKRASTDVAQRLYPKFHFPTTLAGTGISDAVLMAEYGKRLKHGS